MSSGAIVDDVLDITDYEPLESRSHDRIVGSKDPGSGHGYLWAKIEGNEDPYRQ